MIPRHLTVAVAVALGAVAPMGAGAAGPVVPLSDAGSGPAALPLAAGNVVGWTQGGTTPEAWAALNTGGVWGPAAPIGAGALADIASGGGRTLAAVLDPEQGFALRVLELGPGGVWTAVPGLEGQVASGGAALAVNARGEAIVTWARSADPRNLRVFVAWGRAGGAWSTPKQLGPKTAYSEGEPRLRAALDDQSRGTIVWRTRGTVTAAAGVVFGRWALPMGYGTGTPEVVAAGSRTLVVWVSGLRTIRSAGRGAFRLAPPQTVLVAPRGVAIGGAVPAIAQDGTSLIGYTPQTLRRGTYTLRTAAVTRFQTGPWSRPAVLSAPAPPARAWALPAVSVADDGTLAVSWRRAGRVEAVAGRLDRPWGTVASLGSANGRTVPVLTQHPSAGAQVSWGDADRTARTAAITHP